MKHAAEREHGARDVKMVVEDDDHANGRAEVRADGIDALVCLVEHEVMSSKATRQAHATCHAASRENLVDGEADACPIERAGLPRQRGRVEKLCAATSLYRHVQAGDGAARPNERLFAAGLDHHHRGVAKYGG